MIIERLGQGSPTLEEALNMLGAVVEGDRLVIPTHAIRMTAEGIEVNVQHHYSRLHEGEWKLPLIDTEVVTRIEPCAACLEDPACAAYLRDPACAAIHRSCPDCKRETAMLPSQPRLVRVSESPLVFGLPDEGP